MSIVSITAIKDKVSDDYILDLLEYPTRNTPSPFSLKFIIENKCMVFISSKDEIFNDIIKKYVESIRSSGRVQLIDYITEENGDNTDILTGIISLPKIIKLLNETIESNNIKTELLNIKDLSFGCVPGFMRNSANTKGADNPVTRNAEEFIKSNHPRLIIHESVKNLFGDYSSEEGVRDFLKKSNLRNEDGVFVDAFWIEGTDFERVNKDESGNPTTNGHSFSIVVCHGNEGEALSALYGKRKEGFTFNVNGLVLYLVCNLANGIKQLKASLSSQSNGFFLSPYFLYNTDTGDINGNVYDSETVLLTLVEIFKTTCIRDINTPEPNTLTEAGRLTAKLLEVSEKTNNEGIQKLLGNWIGENLQNLIFYGSCEMRVINNNLCGLL